MQTTKASAGLRDPHRAGGHHVHGLALAVRRYLLPGLRVLLPAPQPQGWERAGRDTRGLSQGNRSWPRGSGQTATAAHHSTRPAPRDTQLTPVWGWVALRLTGVWDCRQPGSLGASRGGLKTSGVVIGHFGGWKPAHAVYHFDARCYAARCFVPSQSGVMRFLVAPTPSLNTNDFILGVLCAPV